MVGDLENVSIEHINAFHEKTAGVTKDGKLVMWGRTRDGSIVDGKGNSFKSNLKQPTYFEEVSGTSFQQVSCGKDHIAAITIDGRLLTMGNPGHGKLGHKDYSDEHKSSYMPKSIGDNARIEYLDLKDVKQVSCGFRHTACVTKDGGLYTWGEARNG